MKFRNLNKFVIQFNSGRHAGSTCYRLLINDNYIGLAKEINTYYFGLTYYSIQNNIIKIDYWTGGDISINNGYLGPTKWRYICNAPHTNCTFRQSIQLPDVKLCHSTTYSDNGQRINKLKKIFNFVSVYCSKKIRAYNLNLKI